MPLDPPGSDANVDAECVEHLRIVDAGAYECANARAPVQESQEGRECDAERDDEEAVQRVVAADDGDRSVEARRQRDRADLASERETDEVGDHERHADGEQHLIEMASAQAP